jgi:glycosyltransferase involved in cell wall biosynthesis
MDLPSRPLVTLALMTYNQEQMIEGAVAGALEQTYSPLEILISDDCSTDRTFERAAMMVEGYVGPHQIRLNRNPRNLGLIGHINALFEMAQGEIFVLAAGDDVSLAERVALIVEVFERDLAVMMVHSDVVKLNRDGQELGIWRPPIAGKTDDLLAVAGGFGIHIGATGAYRMAVFERFGPLVERQAYEDLVLGFRARLLGKLAYIESPLVRYRIDTGLSRKQKPLDKEVRTKNRIRSLELKRAVYRQRLVDYRAFAGSELAVIEAIEAGVRDAEDRLSFHEGRLWSRIRARARLPAAVIDELRRAWIGDLKSLARSRFKRSDMGG